MNKSYQGLYQFKSTNVVVIKHKDKYLKAHRGHKDFFAKADGDIIDSSTKWIVELLDDEDLKKIEPYYLYQTTDHPIARVRLKNCKFGKYLRMYDSYMCGDGLVQLSPYSISLNSFQIVFEILPINDGQNVLLRNNYFIQVNKYGYVSSTGGYVEYDEQYKAASKLTFYTDNKPFSADEHPQGILIHDLDFLPQIYKGPFVKSDDSDQGALTLHQKKKKFSLFGNMMTFTFPQTKNDKSEAKFNILKIDDTQWAGFQKFFYKYRNRVDQLIKNKRFYGENEFDELLRLVVYGLLNVLAFAPKVMEQFNSIMDSNKKWLELEQKYECEELEFDQKIQNSNISKIVEMIRWNLMEFESEMINFYKLICSEGIMEWMKLKVSLKCLQLSADVDWNLMSSALKQHDINGINLQFLTKSDWKIIAPFLNDEDRNIVFEETQKLLCKYPETSMFHQRKQNEKQQTEQSYNVGVNGWIMAGIGAIAVYYKVFHS